MDNNNMLKLCRLCLVKDDVNIPIFEEQGDIRQIFLKISSCLPVKVSRDDQLPKKICDGCSYKLDMLYEFWNTSANAEKQLLTWLGEAGMSSQMADGTISAVAQQIKPADAFVKQETIDPPDIHMDDDDDDDEEDKDYMKQEDNSNNVEEPPPKRARRTAAVKAAIALDQNSDDDDDSGEPMTKVEDDSEDSDNEDHEPAFVDVPSTSADDQPGPSGVGKDGVEAPSHAKVDDREILRKFGCLREAYVHLIDLKYDNTIDFNIIGSANDRKKTHTCYICMSKFSSLEDLEIHKYVHSGSDESQTEEDYYCDDDYISLVNECEFLYKIERNMYRVDRGKKTKDPNEDSKQNENENKDDIEKENDENGCKTNLTVDDEDADKIEQINERREENTTDIEKDTTKEDNEKLDEEVFEPDATYRCESCDICFGDPFVINSHKVKCKFSCVTCVKSFKTKWAMLIHIIDHLNNSKHPDKKYICQLCKIKLSNSLKYKRHIWTHSKNAIKKIMEAKKKIQLRKKEAKQKMNELKSNQLTCDLCFDTFKTKSEFDAHAAFHKEMDLISQGEHLDVIAQEENETKHNKMKRISIKNMNDINNIKKIALPRLEINKMKEKKSPPDNFSLEVQRTGPLSYAVTYKLPAIQNKPTCIPIIPVKESIKQEPTDNTKHFLSVDDLVNKTSPTVNKNNVNIMYKSTPTSSSTNTCIAPTTIGTNHRYKTVTNSYIVNNNSNLSTGSIAQLDLSIRNNLNNISYINKQNNIQQISCNVNNAQLLNYNKTVTFPRQINPQIRLRNIRLPSGQIVVSNSAAITSSPRYYHPQNNQYPNRSINLNSQKPPQYSYEQANSNNIQNITNYNQYNQLIISDLRNLPEVEVDRTKFLPETSNSSTHIIASNPFDDTIVQPEANTKMFEDQDFISLNQFEELCKSKGIKT
ncbi:uncharacterized protein PF3D7_1120600-like isoform X4 [Diorhabda carinulata]|uniref:uncharacterized protein PF3D7_1120600-like isoform X4 n=1 Tax=Diorhabda carinulata TaxID=1163345 RepID=UPI0025A11731|nr:uncharacterized protein PF3D7_1120600-like isoform X4 [Diorhabda carinulata]